MADTALISVRDGEPGATRVTVSPHPLGIGWPKSETVAFLAPDQPPFDRLVDVIDSDGVRATVFECQVKERS